MHQVGLNWILTSKNKKHRGWVPKFATGLIYQIEHSSKSIWVTRLLFCQNNSLMGGSFWPKDSLITFIIFELCLIWCISPVANFGTHPLVPRLKILKWIIFFSIILMCKIFFSYFIYDTGNFIRKTFGNFNWNSTIQKTLIQARLAGELFIKITWECP